MNPAKKIRPWMLKKELIVLYYGLRDDRTPIYAKIPAILSVCYLISPIDLIPDFIPFVGYLDDLVIVPLLLNAAIRLLPLPVREASLLKASRNRRKFQFAFVCLIILLTGLLAAIFWWVKTTFFAGR